VAIKIAEATTPDTQDEVSTKSRFRDDDQKDMDTRVAALKADWEAAGKPEQKKAPFRRLTVTKDDRPELKRLIRRAAVLASVEPLYWKDTKPNSDGMVTVKFTVGPRVAKNEDTPATAPAAETAPPANTEPPVNPNADEGGEQPQATPADARRGGLLGRR
jgi:hypothetical protein